MSETAYLLRCSDVVTPLNDSRCCVVAMWTKTSIEVLIVEWQCYHWGFGSSHNGRWRVERRSKPEVEDEREGLPSTLQRSEAK